MGSQQRKTVRVLKKLSERYPHAGTRLKFSSLFELLVAVILSAQSTDEQVNRVTRGLFQHYRTPEEFARLEPQELEPLIRGCGLYRSKARNLVQTARILVNDYQGQVPPEMETLLRLPGVGRKTANVVLSVGFGQPGLGVDTHVFRVSNRLGWHECRRPGDAEKVLKSLIPPVWWAQAHHLLIAHGREACRALRPRCEQCVVAGDCRCFQERQ